jgi:hypothetical protein
MMTTVKLNLKKKTFAVNDRGPPVTFTALRLCAFWRQPFITCAIIPSDKSSCLHSLTDGGNGFGSPRAPGTAARPPLFLCFSPSLLSVEFPRFAFAQPRHLSLIQPHSDTYRSR